MLHFKERRWRIFLRFDNDVEMIICLIDWKIVGGLLKRENFENLSETELMMM